MESYSDYIYDLFDNFLAIDYQEEGGHFLQSLTQNLTKIFPQLEITGHGTATKKGMPGIQYEHFLCTFNGDKGEVDLPAIRIVPLTIKKDQKRGMYVFKICTRGK